MNPNNYLVAMLDAYIEWLNMWAEHDDLNDGFRYTMETFAPHNPHIVGICLTGSSNTFQRVLVEACVYDGDDGGPTDLTAWFELDTMNGTNALEHMIQGFDTMLQFIIRDGKPVHHPTDVSPN
jgi:hypothetical protein